MSQVKLQLCGLKGKNSLNMIKSFISILNVKNDINDYSLIVSGEEYPIFGPNFVYSYLVGAYNREMEFVIQNNVKGVYMTISLDGSSKSILNIDNLYKKHLYIITEVFFLFI